MSMGGYGDPPLSVDRYSVAWRIEVVDDRKHRDFEYVRLGPGYSIQRGGSLTPYYSFYWGSTDSAWDLSGGFKEDGAKVRSSQVLRNYG